MVKSDTSNLSIEELSETIKKEIIKSRIQKWDLFLRDQEVFGVYFRKYENELQTDTRDLRYFLRVFIDKPENKMGIGNVTSNSTKSEDIEKAINYANNIAKENEGPKYELVSSGKSYPSPLTAEKIILDNPIEFLETKSRLIMDLMRKENTIQPTFGKFRIYRSTKILINSENLHLKEPFTNFYYEFSLKAEKSGKLAEHWPMDHVKLSSQLKFEELIPKWAKFANDMISAKEPESMDSIKVLFPPRIVYTAIIETLGRTATAKALYEKMSKLTLNEQIASEKFTMIDDGLLEGGMGSSAWDGDGNPKRSTIIVEKGIMKNFIFDQKYSSIMNSKSTGNGNKLLNSGGSVGISVNNLVVKPGSNSVEDLIKEISNGIYIEEFAWLNPDPLTGTFGAEIRTAYMIGNGEIGQPIKGGNLSGNVYDMVKNITGISNTTEFISNSKVPWISFKDLTLSGN